MILYFSGTGNSRYIAEYLADHLKDEIIALSTYTKTNTYGEFNSEKPYIIVSPVYVSAPPIVVMDFIKNSKFKGNTNWYFLMTCAGGMGACPKYWMDICRESGFHYMGCEQIVMPQNYLAFFKTKEKEECERIIQKSIQELPNLVKQIQMNKTISLNKPKTYETVSTKLILKPYYDLFIKANKFKVNDSCIHCGLCVKACPLNNIQLVNGKPVWSNDCTHCMACINLCPKEAIEYGKNSIGKPRYKAPKYKKIEN